MNPAIHRALSRAGTGLALNLPIYLLASRPSAPAILTPAGLLHALFLSIALFFLDGPAPYILTISFLILGSLATRLGRKQKEAAGIAEARGGARGPENLWGAAGAGALVLTAAWVIGGGVVGPVGRTGFAAATAAKMADTLSSEIGKVYGTKTYSLTSGKRVKPGTEGAVSLEGSTAGLGGAIVAAVIAGGLGMFRGIGWELGVGVVAFAAVVANIFESVIGEKFQGRLGWSGEFVNFLNTSVGAAVAIAILRLVFSRYT